MPELLDSLNNPHDSNLAIMMSRTVGQCEAQEEQVKETRKRVTSLEDMKSFVASNLPQDTRIAALQWSRSIPSAGESRSKDTRKVLDAKAYDTAVVCRNIVFPYAVFECHDVCKSNMRINAVEMEGRDGPASAKSPPATTTPFTPLAPTLPCPKTRLLRLKSATGSPAN